MSRQTTVTEADPGCVSADARVRHYDELDEGTQAYLESAARTAPRTTRRRGRHSRPATWSSSPTTTG